MLEGEEPIVESSSLWRVGDTATSIRTWAHRGWSLGSDRQLGFRWGLISVIIVFGRSRQHNGIVDLQPLWYMRLLVSMIYDEQSIKHYLTTLDYFKFIYITLIIIMNANQSERPHNYVGPLYYFIFWSWESI